MLIGQQKRITKRDVVTMVSASRGSHSSKSVQNAPIPAMADRNEEKKALASTKRELGGRLWRCHELEPTRQNFISLGY